MKNFTESFHYFIYYPLMKRMKIELARPGVHGSGDGVVITKDMLAQMVETFAGDAPVCYGHEQAGEDRLPRCGSVVAVEMVGQRLLGQVELSDWAQTLYDGGDYPRWSIGATVRAGDKKWRLHHLALLGATPPAITGLKELERVTLSDDSGAAVQLFASAGLPVSDSSTDGHLSNSSAAVPPSAQPSMPQASESVQLADVTCRLRAAEAQLLEAKVAQMRDALAGKLPQPVIDGLIALGKGQSQDPVADMITLAGQIKPPVEPGRLVGDDAASNSMVMPVEGGF